VQAPKSEVKRLKIAPNASARDWAALRLDDPHSPDWPKAVQILKSRITSRFLDPIDFLLKSEVEKRPTEKTLGFVVLAIDCALIETLAAFTKGLLRTDGISKRTFSRFLATHPEFCVHFNSAKIAEQFYEEIRCGILHQAETGGNSRVWSVGPLLRVDSGAITVNRSRFHDAVKAAYEKYYADLLDPSNRELRRNFRKKMNYISRI
jgi:hypothetical protein